MVSRKLGQEKTKNRKHNKTSNAACCCNCTYVAVIHINHTHSYTHTYAKTTPHTCGQQPRPRSGGTTRRRALLARGGFGSGVVCRGVLSRNYWSLGSSRSLGPSWSLGSSRCLASSRRGSGRCLGSSRRGPGISFRVR